MQGFGQESGISGRGVGQAKGHPHKLILSEWGRERHLLPVGASDRDRMKGSRPVKGGENATPGEMRQVVGDVGEWEGVILRDIFGSIKRRVFNVKLQININNQELRDQSPSQNNMQGELS